MTQREADATGHLRDTPFPELLVYALGQRLEGTLVVEQPSGQRHAVRFCKGEPVAALLDSPQASEVSTAVQQGLEAALRAYAPHCVALSQLPLRSESPTAQQVELLLKLVLVGRLPVESAFGYFAERDLIPQAPASVRIEPLLAIAHTCIDEGACLAPARVEAHCQRLAQRRLSLHPDARPERFGLAGSSGALLDVLMARPQTLSDLEATGLCSREQVQRVVCMLALCRHIDVGQSPLGVPIAPARRQSSGAARVQVGPEPNHARESPGRGHARESPGRGLGGVGSLPQAGRSEPERSAPLSCEATALRDELQQRFEALEGATHYEVLSVPANASPAELTDAFARLARRTHPDRLPSSLAGLRPTATRLFARVSEAHATLSDPDRRGAYDQSLATDDLSPQGQQEAEQVRAIMQAASDFQKAEVLVQKKDWAGALRFAQQASQLDAEQPQYFALVTWLEARRLPPTADWGPVIRRLDEAVGRAPNSARIRYFRACVFKSAGDLERAMQDFQFVLDREPHHLDAARELRLYEMRQQRNAPSGLLSRLFRRG